MSRSREQEPQAYDAFSAIFKFEPDSYDPDDKDLFSDFLGMSRGRTRLELLHI